MDHLPLQTRTCLFTDIVGSTFLKASLDPRTARAVFVRSIEIFKECLPPKDVEYNDSALQREAAGRIVSDTGDGVFAVFTSALDAVETALKVQWRMSQESWPTPQPITIRIGLDSGDTTTRPDAVLGTEQPFGSATDKAARVMGVAQGGQILMTEGVVYNISNGLKAHPLVLAADSSGYDLTLQLESHGNFRFKGDLVDEGARPVEVFEVRPLALGPCIRPDEDHEKCWPCDESGQRVTGWRPLPGLIVPGTRPDKWVLEKRIGVGGFGAAWLARNRSNQKHKRVFKFCYDLARARSFRREKKIFDLLNDALDKDPALRANIAAIERSSMEASSSEGGPDPLPPYWVQSQHYEHSDLLTWALTTYGKPEDQLTPDMPEEEQHSRLYRALGHIPEPVRLSLWVELARTVHAVHQHGVWHRDIKPTNILIRIDPHDSSPHPVLADFGIGMIDDLTRLDQLGVSRAGFIDTLFNNNSSRTGTRLYTPPEALRGEKPTAAWDIYALGVLLYQLVRGDASLPMDFSWEQHVADPILRADIGKGVFDGDKRWHTAAEFAESVAERDERRRVMEEENAREQLRIEQQKAKRRQILTTVIASLTIVAATGAWFGLHQADVTEQERAKTAAALVESNLQHDRAWVEEGRAWIERGRAALNKGDHISALMLTGRAIGYEGYGRMAQETKSFDAAFPLLLARPMQQSTAEKASSPEEDEVSRFIDSVRPTCIPQWASVLRAQVLCVVFSPDGSRFACGSAHVEPTGIRGEIKIWDAATGKELALLNGHSGIVMSVAFSPDGRQLASGSRDHTIKLWDATTGKELTALNGHTSSVTSVAFSPDGRQLVSGSWDNTIKLWDATTGKELTSLNGHTSSVTSVAFSPDGRQLASGSWDHTIKLWDATTGKEARSLQSLSGSVLNVTFSPECGYLSSCGVGTTTLWDPITGKELVRLAGHKYCVRGAAFSPNSSSIASGADDKTIKLWDTATGKEFATLTGHAEPVVCVAFSPDGSRFASGSRDKSVKVWDATMGNDLVGHTSVVRSVAFSPDGSHLASSSEDKTIKLWDVTTSRELASLDGHTGAVSSVVFSPEGRCLASASNDGQIRLWDAATGKKLASLDGHEGWVSPIIFSPDSTRLASGAYDKTIKLWDVAMGKEIASLTGHTSGVSSVAFSPDGSRLASGSHDETIKLWDVATRRELSTLRGHTSAVWIIAFSPDGGRLASGSSDKTIKLWDAATGKEFATLTGHAEPVECVAFSPDGSKLASSSYNTVKLWDVATGKEHPLDVATLAGVKQWLAAQKHRLSPDHRNIVELEGNRVRLVPANLDLDLTAPLRVGLLGLPARELQFPEIKQTTPMLHVRQDTLAQLANPALTPERRAELRMELCTKSSQFRAATALWQRLLQGEWPGFEGATTPKDQAPATIPADSPIRRLYLLALIDATKHPQIHGHPTICQTAAQIAPVLTKEMMATPTISLAMMSLMQTLAKDDSPNMKAPREAVLQRLNELASKEWLEVLRESTTK